MLGMFSAAFSRERCLRRRGSLSSPPLRVMIAMIVVYNAMYEASLSADSTLDGVMIAGVVYSSGRTDVRIYAFELASF